jgi:type II secretory pathway predicted ATPase ExeA
MNTLEHSEDGQTPVEHSPRDGSAEGKDFFPGGHHRETLDAMLEAISAGVPILTLTGEDGSGKTMMCRMIEERMSSGHVVVFFPRTIDSFEEVVRIVAQRLEIGAAAGGSITTGLLQAVISDIHSRNIHLLLIFDEAERIYLATLERVRKMLDLTNISGLFLQIVLSGGIGLHNNFKHLALCNFQQVEERQFALAAFPGDDTHDSPRHTSRDEKAERPGIINRGFVTRIFSAAHGHLQSSRSQAKKAVQGLGPANPVPVLIGDDSDESPKQTSRDERPEKPKRPDIINRQLVTRIFSAAHGNLQSIKSQAKKAFQVLGAAISIPVPAKRTAEAEDTARPRRRLKRPAISLKWLTANRRYLVWGSGIAVLVLVALLFLQPGPKTEGPPVAITPETKDTIVISQPEALERRSESTAEFSEEKIVEEKKEQERPGSSAEPPGENRQDQELPAATSVAEVRPVTELVEEKPAAPLEAALPVAPGRSVQQATETEESQPGESERENPSTPVAVDQPVPKPAAKMPAAPAEAVQPGQPVRGQSATPARTAQVVEEDQKTAEQQVVKAPPLKPAEENVAETDGNRVSSEADQEKTVAPARILEARQVVKHRDLLSSAAPVATIGDPARISRSQEKTKITEIPVPARIKAERKEQAKLTDEPTPQITAEPKTVTAKVVEQEPVPAKKGESVERVYNRRSAAGSTWLLGNKDDRYTIQLMVVTSNNAEEQVKDLLAQEEYRGQADKFYILKKVSNPGVQYIYYGEYPTMTDARNARNTMPNFLRGHKPYAMSVKGAVRKALEDE